MRLYHGSNAVVNNPDILHSLRNLDFGKGFYTTSVQTQAERWALRKASMSSGTCGFVSYYSFIENSGVNVLNFKDNVSDWIDFVCECRSGSTIYRNYDLIVGKVADDKVFQVVDLYKRGIWDKDKAIKEMRAYEMYDQYVFVSQDAIDSMLSYEGFYEMRL